MFTFLINNSQRFTRYVLYECRYHMDPSGTFVQCDARAIGSASEGAQSSLQEVYHKVQNAAYLNRKIYWDLFISYYLVS